MTPKTITSSVAINGCTRLRLPTRNASLETNPINHVEDAQEPDGAP